MFNQSSICVKDSKIGQRYFKSTGSNSKTVLAIKSNQFYAFIKINFEKSTKFPGIKSKSNHVLALHKPT